LNKVNSVRICYKSQMKADNFSEILQLILKRVKDCVKISAFC
jgi:hypothetical protein